MIDLPPAQVQCVAIAIYHEARGETDLGKRAVGHVILNRSKKLGKTPCQVIRQPGQFQFKLKRHYTGKSWDKAVQIAYYLGDNPVGASLYFKSVNCKLKWRYKLVTRIGGHNFYK